MDGSDREQVTLELVGPGNLPECGIGCVTNTRHEGFAPKVGWLQKRFEEGLRYFLFRAGDGKPLAFLEFVPGEHAWRPVDAGGWLFIHCLWVYSRGRKIGGLGLRLIQACLGEGRKGDFIGVATLASEGPWMAGPRVFERAGFQEVDRAERFSLLANQLRPGPSPGIRPVESNRHAYEGLHVVYSAQCPYLPKSVHALRRVAAEYGLELRVTVLDTPEKAQRAPSYYGVFSLLFNGEQLADHYVSETRFRNILRRCGIHSGGKAANTEEGTNP